MRNQIIVIIVALAACVSWARAQHGVEFTRADSIIDLRTDAGAELIRGQWRYADAKIIAVAHRAPGHDLTPSGAPTPTNDIEPKAGVADFDDSAWEQITAPSLEARRSTGRLAFGWYRINVTVPA